MKTSLTRIRKLYLAPIVAMCLATPALAVIPGHSHAFGNSLADWDNIYARSGFFGELVFPIDRNGNAVVGNHVVLMPIPNAPGDGTPGHLDVTLSSGQAFVLPLWGLFGFEYTPETGLPPDEFAPLSVFQTLNITFKVDGITVVNTANVLDFYSAFFFNPPIPVVDPEVNSIIWYQAISIVYHPLSVGTHTLQLDAVNTEPAFGSFFEYHNTWTITVQPGKK